MGKKGVALLSLLGLTIVGAVLAPSIVLASFVSSQDINKDVSVKRTIYLNAVSTSLWGESNANHNRFAVWAWGGGKDGVWANAESFMEHYDGLVYRAVLPSTTEHVIFVKLSYDPQVVFPSWDNKVTQTDDLDLSANWDTFTVTSKGTASVNATGNQTKNYNA